MNQFLDLQPSLIDFITTNRREVHDYQSDPNSYLVHEQFGQIFNDIFDKQLRKLELLQFKNQEINELNILERFKISKMYEEFDTVEQEMTLNMNLIALNEANLEGILNNNLEMHNKINEIDIKQLEDKNNQITLRTEIHIEKYAELAREKESLQDHNQIQMQIQQQNKEKKEKVRFMLYYQFQEIFSNNVLIIKQLEQEQQIKEIDFIRMMQTTESLRLLAKTSEYRKSAVSMVKSSRNNDILKNAVIVLSCQEEDGIEGEISDSLNELIQIRQELAKLSQIKQKSECQEKYSTTRNISIKHRPKREDRAHTEQDDDGNSQISSETDTQQIHKIEMSYELQTEYTDSPDIHHTRMYHSEKPFKRKNYVMQGDVEEFQSEDYVFQYSQPPSERVSVSEHSNLSQSLFTSLKDELSQIKFHQFDETLFTVREMGSDLNNSFVYQNTEADKIQDLSTFSSMDEQLTDERFQERSPSIIITQSKPRRNIQIQEDDLVSVTEIPLPEKPIITESNSFNFLKYGAMAAVSMFSLFAYLKLRK